MTIAVVQSAGAGNQASTTFAGNFGSNVTAANTVLLAAVTFSSSNVTISSSAPTLGGSSVSGSSKLAEVQSAYTAGNTAYAAIWLLPNAAGGATSFGLTVANGTTGNSQTGLLAWEVSGLGAAPALDVSSTSSGASTSATSGTTGATTQNAELILGVLMGLDGLAGTPGQPAGYTNLNIGGSGSASVGGYQIQSSSGSTYTYANANGGSNVWAGAIVAVYAPSGTPHTATGSLTVTPAFSLKKAEAHVESLTVQPAFAIVKAEAHKQSLQVAPRFAAGQSHTGPSIGGNPDRHHHRAGPWGR